MRKLFAGALAGTIVLSLGGVSSAQTTYVPTEHRFFMRNSATGCPGTPFLSLVEGANEVACGFIGGAPFGELAQLGLFSSTTKTYSTDGDAESEGQSLLVDAARNVTGNVRVVATSATQRNAVGQVIVEVTIAGRNAADEQVTLGSISQEKLQVPGEPEKDFAFTIDVPDAMHLAELTEVRALVNIRGWHVLTGYHRLNGESWFVLPTLKVEEEPVAPPAA